MGQQRPHDAQITYKVSQEGGFYLTVEDESVALNGRGIRQVGDGSTHKRGKRTFTATHAAMDKIEAQYRCAYESVL